MGHSITSSAITSNDCGIVSPSTFAVFRLMTSSKFPWLLERKIAGFGALEDLVHVSRRVAVRLDRVAAA